MTSNPLQARPDWHYAAGIGEAWHGLELLGAKTPAEMQRMGFDVVYFEGAPAGAEPVVDVYHARVVFPAPPKRGRRPSTITAANLAELRPTSDLAWPFTWPAYLADARRQGLIEIRRMANRARARLGLLSTDDEDNILNAGGSVDGAYGYDRAGRLLAVGPAAHSNYLTPGRHRPGQVPMAGVRYKGKL